MKVTNPLSEDQKANGLIPLTIKFREVMLVHPDIVNDKQWDLSQPKVKGKSYNVISLSWENDIVPTTSLSSFEEEGFALAVQLATSQPVGTRSKKWYLRQYDQTPE